MQNKFDRKVSKRFWREYDRFSEINPVLADKIDKLVAEILKTPRSGTGKPERLRHCSDETWSRRIDQKNRIMYSIIGDTIYFESCAGHYGDH